MGQSNSTPLLSKMSDICSELGAEAVDNAVGIVKRDNPEINSIFNKVGVKQRNETTKRAPNKQFFQRANHDIICRIFNRSLMLPIDLQTIFFDEIKEQVDRLKKAGKYFYSPIIREYFNIF